MSDTHDVQSIQDNLPESQQSILTYQKHEYYQNLKSQCILQQNALKTAETLIQEYQRENHELKSQIMKLNKKIQKKDEELKIIKDQFEKKSIKSFSQMNKSNQKQMIKLSNKLADVLQKYSQLQSRYYQIERDAIKYQNYCRQLRVKLDKMKQEQQIIKKTQIEKQFNSFLKTPINKQSQTQSECNQNHNNGIINSGYKMNNRKKNPHQQKNSDSQVSDNSDNIQFSSKKEVKNLKDHFSKNGNESAKKSIYNQQISRITQKQTSLNQKIKILEWRLTQKDEQIMLMLRRNKQIQQKYQFLAKMFAKQRQKAHQKSQNQLSNTRNQQNSHKKLNQKESSYPKITYFNPNVNQSTENSSWRNFSRSFYN